ncbi:hypothetical protein [Peribacillus simplex]|uniref:hypothetical protein n=1 Tax=Peribacillus simplex TaxID=1478 RepID=UPI0024C12AC1|nr:hypothetical protein [Peribacillus simplex]WHY57665.1 hypothetical protein QNH43_05080 [Peribacillus simplex]
MEISLDIRHHEEEVLERFCKEILSTFEPLAKEGEMKLEVSRWMDVKPVAMDREMNRLVRLAAVRSK